MTVARQWTQSLRLDATETVRTTATADGSDEPDASELPKVASPISWQQLVQQRLGTGATSITPGTVLAEGKTGGPSRFSTRGALVDLTRSGTENIAPATVRNGSPKTEEQITAGTLPLTTTVTVPTVGARSPQTFDLSSLLQPGGEARMAEQVKWVMRAGMGTAEFKLHPPSLGAMDVRVTMEADKVHVQFVSPHPIVREVLDAALPRLREALTQDGVALGTVSVSDQASEGHREAHREQAGDGHDRQYFDGAAGEMTETPPLADSTLSVLSRRHDYFV